MNDSWVVFVDMAVIGPFDAAKEAEAFLERHGLIGKTLVLEAPDDWEGHENYSKEIPNGD
jgi:hypothetical protein